MEILLGFLCGTMLFMFPRVVLAWRRHDDVKHHDILWAVLGGVYVLAAFAIVVEAASIGIVIPLIARCIH